MGLIAIGKKTVTAAGTPEAVTATAQRLRSIKLQALPTNTGKVWVGTSALNKSTGAGVLHVIEAPSGSTSIPGVTLGIEKGSSSLQATEIYIDVDTSGEGVHVAGNLG